MWANITFLCAHTYT